MQQGYSFWQGFSSYITHNWAQTYAIASLIFIAAVGVDRIVGALRNAGANKALANAQNYPPNNGAVPGTEETIALQPGEYGRYGGITEKNRYITEIGADPRKLSLKPGTNINVYDKITVLKPIPNTVQSTIAPWAPWNAIGGGTQYLLPDTIFNLKALGFLIF